MNYQLAIIAFVASLVPVLLWLWFWEHEDKHPEPHKLTFYAFLAGMVTVLIVLPIEGSIAELFKYQIFDPTTDRVIVFTLWAIVEELGKFGLAYLVVLRRAENDEPVDSLMYLITVALGFSAVENTLFILKPLINNEIGVAIVTSNFRFIGATVLHTVASSIIGICLALAFYKSDKVKRIYLAVGLVLAVVLHTFFNLFIILFEGKTALLSFFAVWIGMIALLFLFEKIKRIKKPLK
jgi:RsiW-degrading membrane proteinase PrsW (M82 family)